MENRAWLLFTKKLTGEASNADIHELNKLLSSQPALFQELSELESIWKSRKPAQSEEVLNEAFEKLAKKMQQQNIAFDLPQPSNPLQQATLPVFPIKKSLSWVAAIAAAVLVMAAIWWLIPNNQNGDQQQQVAKQNEVSTRPGSRSKLLLPDGTQVWLNADSKLTYGNEFGVTSRDVVLSGEAYFDVAHNKEVPFYISTSSIKIKVTGTAFNVRAYPNESRSETSLLRGKVEVTVNDQPDKTYYLKPSEKLVVNSKDVKPVVASKISGQELTKLSPKAFAAPVLQKLVLNAGDSYPVETAWVNNTLAFSDESFRSIADKMERWYSVKIVFASTVLEQMHFTGSFENETVTQALDAMKISSPFMYSMKDNSIVIYSVNK